MRAILKLKDGNHAITYLNVLTCQGANGDNSGCFLPSSYVFKVSFKEKPSLFALEKVENNIAYYKEVKEDVEPEGIL
jgi:hypothetical protein